MIGAIILAIVVIPSTTICVCITVSIWKPFKDEKPQLPGISADYTKTKYRRIGKTTYRRTR